MSYGFQVLGADGSLMCDSRAVSLHYLGQATSTGSVGQSPGTIWEYNISSPAGAPSPAVSYTAGSGVIIDTMLVSFVSGTTWQIRVYSSDNNTAPAVHCFAPLSGNTPNSSYGLQVFTAGGAVSFDSTRGPLAPDALVNMPEYNGWTFSTTADIQTVAATIPPNLAVMGSTAMEGRPANGSVLFFYRGGIRVDTASVTRKISALIYSAQGGSANVGLGPAESYFLINMARYT